MSDTKIVEKILDSVTDLEGKLKEEKNDGKRASVVYDELASEYLERAEKAEAKVAELEKDRNDFRVESHESALMAIRTMASTLCVDTTAYGMREFINEMAGDRADAGRKVTELNKTLLNVAEKMQEMHQTEHVARSATARLVLRTIGYIMSDMPAEQSEKLEALFSIGDKEQG